uniref:Serine-threonine/tyrosine-protein kinase catalytic domain-containing protein n=1 Tax=Glycine max TaxID=3847 RepID=K7MMR1_SOYBN
MPKNASDSSLHLRIATNNYSYLLGSGGFGKVYKGIFSNGTIVAVKFMADVGRIGKTHHFNLVWLYEFCFERNMIALVYEYMGNGSLEKGRGTPGYAALELWMPNFPVTHKCYVYSFGILLFEIIGRRRNLGVQLVESQEWFPIWIWKRFDAGEFQKLIIACGIKEKNREITERMVDVALSFVQYRPDSRPIMSDVVKMLEGSVEILKPLNPFQPFMDGNFTSHPVQVPLTYTTDTNGFSDVVTDSSIVHVTLIL